MSEPIQDLLSQLSQIVLICQASLKALPRGSSDPDKQPKIENLPRLITETVDLLEQVASNLELKRGEPLSAVAERSAALMAKVKLLEVFPNKIQ